MDSGPQVSMFGSILDVHKRKLSSRCRSVKALPSLFFTCFLLENSCSRGYALPNSFKLQLSRLSLLPSKIPFKVVKRVTFVFTLASFIELKISFKWTEFEQFKHRLVFSLQLDIKLIPMLLKYHLGLHSSLAKWNQIAVAPPFKFINILISSFNIQKRCNVESLLSQWTSVK